MRRLTALIIFMQLAGPAHAHAVDTEQPAAPAAVTGKDAFAQISQMVGVWRPADKPESTLRVRFYLTAGDTVLVESWEVRGRPHSMTLYHRDGDGLLATHYCPQGNQPRLELAGRDARGLHFAFRDATDLDANSESHQHDLWLDLSDPQHPVRSETYASNEGIGALEQLRLVAADQN